MQQALSKPKIKSVQEFCEVLRNTKEKQCWDTCFDDKSGGYCAMGVFLKHKGVRDSALWAGDARDIATDIGAFPEWMLTTTSDDSDIISKIIHYNDFDEYSFKEIADRIEAEFG